MDGWKGVCARGLACGLCALPAAGCAIDAHGFARVQRAHSSAGEICAIESWGLHISTVAGDAGLTLGHTRRVYGYRAAQPAAAGALAAFPQPAQLALHVDAPDAAPSDLARPVLYSCVDHGLSLGLGAQRGLLRLGVIERHAIVLPADFDGVLCVVASSPGRMPEAFYCQESLP